MEGVATALINLAYYEVENKSKCKLLKCLIWLMIKISLQAPASYVSIYVAVWCRIVLKVTIVGIFKSFLSICFMYNISVLTYKQDGEDECLQFPFGMLYTQIMFLVPHPHVQK
jgi:hypothetical protein